MTMRRFDTLPIGTLFRKRNRLADGNLYIKTGIYVRKHFYGPVGNTMRNSVFLSTGEMYPVDNNEEVEVVTGVVELTIE